MPRHTKEPKQPETFLDPYIQALAGAGVEAIPLAQEIGTAPGQPRLDAWMLLRGPWGERRWACELKYRLERGAVAPVIHRIKQLQAQFDRVLLLTEHVTPPLAEDLRREGVAFVDAAGNAFLNDTGLHVWVTHRPPNRAMKGGGRGLHAAGLRLLFVLLRQRVHENNLRDLAMEAGIALGSVTRILDELERREWIRRMRKGVTLQDTAAMLKRWDEGYADTLRPKLFLKACRQRPGTELDQLPRKIVAGGLRDKILVGGELGAALLTQYLRPGTATLHLEGIDPTETLRQLELVPDRRGDIMLVQAFGHMNRGPETHTGDARLADPLLIRGELLLVPGDRLRELAERVHDDQIAPRWR